MKMRNEMIKLLNDTYERQIYALSKQELAYRKLVNSYPARFLSGYTYEEIPKPLRSQRVAVQPIETDVIEH